MSSKRTSLVTEPGVIAITQEESKLKAVQLVRRGGTFELLWAKSGEAGQSDLGAFAVECNSSAGSAVQTETDKSRIIVAGFDSAGVVFYRINVPAVREEEIAAMVKLQAESRLPLPAEQMELAWRAGSAQNGQVAVTIAAAKREHLRRFVESVRGFEPAKILLDCEGIVKAWRTFFSGNDEPAVVVSVGERNTQVCLAERGRLANAVSLDMGLEDFSGAGRLAGRTETADRFAQDMRSVLELFGYAAATAVSVFVLSDGGSVIKDIVSCLRSAGLNVEAALPDVQKLAARMELGIEGIYEYRVPIGLASMALDGDAEELNVFERLYKAAGEEVKKHWYYSPKVSGTIAVVMLALLAGVFCAVDLASDRHLGRLEERGDFEQLEERQELIRTVARQRPDLLQLLSEISSSEGEGILLNSFHFKMGQPVRISGQAGKAEQFIKFEKSLQEKKGVKELNEEDLSADKESKKLKFTITFDYGSFTKKKSRAQVSGLGKL
ncbi:MAG: hypothetical protein ACYSW4_01575 [Planctomycetota bacterium]|jgi:hypothetical protein